MKNEACVEFEILMDRLDLDFDELKKRASESGIPYDIVEFGFYRRPVGQAFVKLQTSTASDAVLLRNALNAVYSGLGKGIYACKGFSQDRASVLETLRKTAVKEGLPEAIAARAYRILRNEGLLDRFESPEGNPDIFSYRVSHSKGCGSMTHHLIMKAYGGTGKDDVLDEFDSMAADMGIAEKEAKCVRTLLVRSNHLRSLMRNPNLKTEQLHELLLNCKGVGPSRSALLSHLRSRYLSKSMEKGGA